MGQGRTRRTVLGAGPHHIAMIHGFLGASRNLRSLALRMVEADSQLAVHLVDLLGHGVAPPLPEGAKVATLADDLRAELQASTPAGPPWRLVGHSLGGLVALAWAKAHPAEVDHIVLLDVAPAPFVGFDAQTASLLRILLAAPEHAPSREAMRRHLEQPAIPMSPDVGVPALSPATIDWLMMNLERRGEALSWRFDRRALAAFRGRLGDFDFWSVVDDRRTRVDCLRGSDSPFVGEEAAARMGAAGGLVLTVEGAGHNVHMDRPAEVQAQLLALLARQR